MRVKRKTGTGWGGWGGWSSPARRNIGWSLATISDAIISRENAFDVEKHRDTMSGPFTKLVNPHNVGNSSDLTSNVERSV
jgi:hypothetical protein